MNLFSLAGRKAMITGGSRGIGFGIARALAESGASVLLVAREQAGLERAANALRQQGLSAAVSPFDLCDTEDISDWFTSCSQLFGEPDILINAAGITVRGEATQLSLSDWDRVLSVNATAIFELSRCFARSLIAQKRGGKIVNIASLMTAAARRGTSAYAASKGAVGQLTKSLAIDWAAFGIHVNAVAPGYIATDLNLDLQADPQFDGWVKSRCPLGRWGRAEDVAWPAVFLASAASDFITGHILYVDGGWISSF
jgi:gluconate 5-dehydrogenase